MRARRQHFFASSLSAPRGEILDASGNTLVESREMTRVAVSLPEIREFIGADSLAYLSIRGVLAALDLPYERFCFACFDGHYPEPVPYDVNRKQVLEEVPEPALAGVSAPCRG